jgi:hypothetical protein
MPVPTAKEYVLGDATLDADCREYLQWAVQPKGRENLSVRQFTDFVNTLLRLHDKSQAAEAGSYKAQESMKNERKVQQVSPSTGRRMLHRLGYKYNLVKRCVRVMRPLPRVTGD